MTYDGINDLPRTIAAVLPEEAQEVYRQAYNKAWDQAGEQPGGGLSRESLAHRQAWTILEREYARDFATGKWRRKGETVVVVKEPRGLLPWLRRLFRRSNGHS